MTPSKTDTQQNAEQTRDQNQQTSAADASTVRSADSDVLSGTITDSPYYKNEVKAGQSATTGGYDASRRNLRAQMESAGVTGDSGVSAGNNTALDAQEAHDIGLVKTNAFSDTQNQRFKAASQIAGLSGMESGAGLGYTGVANQDELNRQAQGNANKIALAKAIATAAGGV